MAPYLAFTIGGGCVVVIGILMIVFESRVTIFTRIYSSELYGDRIASRISSRVLTILGACFTIVVGAVLAAAGVVGLIAA